MDSIHPSASAACRITPPQGWMVQAYPGSILVVRSADGEAFALVEFITGPASQLPLTEILGKGRFHSTTFFQKPKAPEVASSSTATQATGSVRFSTQKGVNGRASLVCMKRGANIVFFAYAAPEQSFAEIEPLLYRIFEFAGAGVAPCAEQPAPAPQVEHSHASAVAQPVAARYVPLDLGPMPRLPIETHDPVPAPPAPHADAVKHQVEPPHPPPVPVPAPSPYEQFTEPEKGTYVIEVPRGWQVKGGFFHPMPGDRRPWIEAISPDGIYIASDPHFPQNLCHFRDQMEGQPANLAAGGQMLNLSPTAQRAGDFYVTNFASAALGFLLRKQRLARPDMVELLTSQLRGYGLQITPKWAITADEVLFDCNRGGQPQVLSVLSIGSFNGEYMMGMWGFWEASVVIYIAPPHLTARAEEVRAHLKKTVRFTPRLVQIYQQDEAQIAANARMAHQAQQNWFVNEQAAHNLQTAFGDSIVNNYWRNNR